MCTLVEIGAVRGPHPLNTGYTSTPGYVWARRWTRFAKREEERAEENGGRIECYDTVRRHSVASSPDLTSSPPSSPRPATGMSLTCSRGQRLGAGLSTNGRLGGRRALWHCAFAHQHQPVRPVSLPRPPRPCAHPCRRSSQSASTRSARVHPPQRAIPPTVWHPGKRTGLRAQAERTVRLRVHPLHPPGPCSAPRMMYGMLTLVGRRSAALDPRGERISRAFRVTHPRRHVYLSSIFPIPKSSSASAPAPGARTQPPHGHVSLPALNSSRGQSPRTRRSSACVISILVPVPLPVSIFPLL
ncbi:hypothetical protein C8R44DRAFT_992623 [Mycena epipterygia]|nr:hypothetical protein C8R44DRAFT_992623 [Mycena epipterygia]